MATPLYSPASGYGTYDKYTNSYFVQTPTGGGWSPVPASTRTPQYSGIVGQKLGASTTGGGGGGGNQSARDLMLAGRIPWDDNVLNSGRGPSVPSYEDRTRGEISGAYDSYYGQLDQMMSGLEPQRTAQEGIVSSQYNQGVNTLGEQKTIGMNELGTQRTRTTENQNRNLKNLAENLRNSFLAGSIYLGARGAGDSSAANMYSYALTKLGNKQRGDVMAQTSDIMRDIDDREFRLNTTYNTELKNLEETKNQKILDISRWFSEAQNQIRGMRASGELNKGRDLAALSQSLLSNALNQLNAIDADNRNRRSMLEQWAMNHSDNIQALKQNLAGISTTNYTMPRTTPITGTPVVDASGNISTQAPINYGYSPTSNEEKLKYSNPLTNLTNNYRFGIGNW